MSDNILQEMPWLIKEVDWWADIDGREWNQQKGKGLTGSGLRGEIAERSLLLPEVFEFGG